MYLHYYVYAYLRKSDNTPYYIGKGQTDRAYRGRHSVTIPKDPSKILILESNLSESDALDAEIKYIKQYGRKDLGTGILHNKTNGGEGVSGKVFTEEQRKQRAARMLGNNIATKTVYTEERRQARSERAKGNQNARGGKSKTGQTLSESTKLLIGAARKGAKWWTNGVINKVVKECPGPGWTRGKTT